MILILSKSGMLGIEGPGRITLTEVPASDVRDVKMRMLVLTPDAIVNFIPHRTAAAPSPGIRDETADVDGAGSPIPKLPASSSPPSPLPQ